ncbi:MAG: tryptophan 7-halogenase [Acidobacteria bacterium]|nr:tryptophan 7-halogenase [Acidobacteriota bacterium]
MRNATLVNGVPEYDLIICGGGIAGLGLAHQLALRGDDISVLVLDLLSRPLPPGAFKVGESTIETGAYYYHGILGLYDYLEAEQLEKNGLRYFYGGGHGDFAAREEYGVRRFLPAKSYQLDRGTLENHLRDLVEADGCDLREGIRVKDIEIGTPHEVTFTDAAGTLHRARSRWVVDAMGRRRYLAHKLKLDRDWRGPCSSAWWRVKGKVSVNDFVPKSNARWHARIEDDRWQSTTHMMGKGYWVWLIPVAPDNTSVGIVSSEAIHPINTYGLNYEQALEWLRTHEPVVAQALEGHELMDFLKLKRYSHTATQLFSTDRWACTGVSGAFADPYYSVGSNMIGFANGFICRMLEMDRAGTLNQEYVDHANRYLLTLNDFLTDTIQRGYPNHHIGPIMALKTIWDYYIGWTTTDPQFYHELYLDPTLSKIMSGVISRIVVTQARMMTLFEDWGRRTDTTGYTFEFIDYIEHLPTLKDLHVRNLPPKTDDFRMILDNTREAVDRIEELAHIIFFLAVRDLMPEQMARLESAGWINTEAIGLDPDRWERDGLFAPKTARRDFARHRGEIEGLFTLRPASAGV